MVGIFDEDRPDEELYFDDEEELDKVERAKRKNLEKKRKEEEAKRVTAQQNILNLGAKIADQLALYQNVGTSSPKITFLFRDKTKDDVVLKYRINWFDPNMLSIKLSHFVEYKQSDQTGFFVVSDRVDRTVVRYDLELKKK